MNKYEAIYIINTGVEESAIKALVAKFNDVITGNGGTIEKVDEWGKRRLAYPIDDMNDGYYVLLHFTAAPELPRELERNLQNNENILRYLIVKLEQKKSSVKPRPAGMRPFAAYPPVDAAPAAPAVEAAVEAAAEAAETAVVAGAAEAVAVVEAPEAVAVATAEVVETPAAEAQE